MKNGLFAAVLVAALASCAMDKNVVDMTIASETRLADAGGASMRVLLVKEGDAQQWQFFYSNIEGFSYEPGYEYVLKVSRENKEGEIPAGASSIRYTLIKEISKTRKTSQNMPENIVQEQ
ncbi:MAG: DUF4377 domain-containing protein [Spirochaetota bacterium]|jgi:opacity protein-like surface antigen|nr:DUF4377 domain-containing protein [Spirochaetota bacterium]